MGNKKMTALLLCGGKSTRMGVDKQKLSYNGVYLIDTIIENLAKNFDQIIILSNEKNFFENRYKNYKNDILIKEDIIKNIGPCAGLYSGLIYAKNEDNFLIACDMPYFNQAYIDFLKGKSYEKILEGKMVGDTHIQGITSTNDLEKEDGYEKVLDHCKKLKDLGAEVLTFACTGLSTNKFAPLIERDLPLPVVDCVYAEAVFTYASLIKKNFYKK